MGNTSWLHQELQVPHMPWRSICAVVPILLSTLSLCPRASAEPDYFFYQVPFPPSPANGDQALATLDHRAEAAIEAVACGNELNFASYVKDGVTKEDSTALVIGKMEWLAGHPDLRGKRYITKTVCKFTRTVRGREFCNLYNDRNDPRLCENPVKFESDFKQSTIWKNLRAGRFSELNDRLESLYRPYCGVVLGENNTVRSGVVAASRGIDTNYGPIDDREFVQLDFAVSRHCMLAQINASLLSMSVQQTPGSSGLPCKNDVFVAVLTGQPTIAPAQDATRIRGDWDMAVKDLIRIAYLDKRYGFALLDQPARSHLQEQLLTLDGGPAEESYSLLGCGNTEESTGTSQERADERDWIDDFGSWLWDLFRFLLYFVFFLVSAGLYVLTFGTLNLLGVALGAGTPETENHLLMINTSKYLKNQFIIQDLGPGSDDAEGFEEDQLDLREWLLKSMQGFVQNDFIEYNSRPYQRLSMLAILNIYDFADDGDLRTGAELVLDYTTAKFAIGSSQGRRFVPFRRLRDVVAELVDTDAKRCTAPEAAGDRDLDLWKICYIMHNGLFDQVEGADYQIPLGLYYSGQIHQLRDGKISFGAAAGAAYAATSYYRPEAFVIDLAIRKVDAVYQRIYHHSTGEIYSSGRGYLISAGGVQTGYAYAIAGVGNVADRGTALPIVLFITGRELPPPSFIIGPPALLPMYVDRTTLGDFIRITGEKEEEVEVEDGNVEVRRTYDHNLCVWDGFACGLNLEIPTEFNKCMSKGPPGSPAEWDFIDTKLCEAYADAPRSFIALYREACRNTDTGCWRDFGFFEIVDAEPTDSFDAFKSKIIQINPTPSIPGDKMTGVYRSFRNQIIAFDCEAHQNDSDKWGIQSVDGLSQPDLTDWPFAGGGLGTAPSVQTVMTGNGDGLLHISNPRLNWRLDLDFRDMNNPMRARVPPPS
jgi:hypothetical protein